MGESENAVYDFVRLVNNDNGMGNNITLNSRTVVIENNKQHIATFLSDIYIETKFCLDVLVVTIMDDKIKTYTDYAMFWTNHYNFKLNGNRLEITKGNNMITIS